MSNETCQNCQYFRQHYGLDHTSLFRVFCGHCTFSKVRKKYPDTPACDHFVPGLPDRESFVTKEYLSKELLQYVLNLELLPEIPELPATQEKE